MDLTTGLSMPPWTPSYTDGPPDLAPTCENCQAPGVWK
jgi:hypothetical protein